MKQQVPVAYEEPNGNKRSMGLIRDEREHQFRIMCSQHSLENELPPVDVSILPVSMGVSEWLQIEDQGQLGSCQGHARTTAEELGIYFETKEKPPQLNRMFAYITSQMIDGIQGDRGSTISGGAEASQQYGSCLESLWEYKGVYTRNIPQACYTEAKNRKLRAFKTLRSYDMALRWLAHGIGGIVIGIGWNRSCEPNGDGLIRNYQSGGGGHALALVDWNGAYRDSNKRPFIAMANSWGRRWGQNGYAYVSPSVIDYWCENETVIGYTDMDGAAIVRRPFVMGL